MDTGQTKPAPATTAPHPTNRSGAVGLRERLRQLIDDYQRQSKYFKWKSWIVVGYAVIALTSLIILVWPANSIHAFTRVTRSKMDGQTLVYVRNDSAREWKRLRIIINDAWELDRDSLPSQENIDVNLSLFHAKDGAEDGAHPPDDLKFQSIVVKCDRGSYAESFD